MAKVPNITHESRRNVQALVIAVVAILVIAGTVFMVYQTQKGPGATQSHATQDTTLTPGDDALSLDKDLETLKVDTTTDNAVIDQMQ